MMKFLRRFADLRITAVLLLLFAIDTLLGTLMQASHGLWVAQQAFFHSWIAQIPITAERSLPFFGVPLIGSAAIINLTAVLFFRMPWKLRNAGLLVLHFGIISLLLSAGLAWTFSRSAFVDLGPGEVETQAESSHEWELVFRVADDSGATIWRIPMSSIREGESLDLGPRAPKFKVKAIAGNASLGSGQNLIPILNEPDPEKWSPALLLDIDSTTPQTIGLTPTSSPWKAVAGQLLFLRREQLRLPYPLRLKKFEREYHPGTGIAARYESIVIVDEGTSQREARISMNRPLRIGDFTIFQSSWRTDPATGLDRSIFAVVKNPLRNAPYAATILIGIGMALHMFLRRKRSSSVASLSWLLLAGFLGTSSVAEASPANIPSSLLQYPIQVDGRVKPMETYARQLLLQVSGKSSLSWKSTNGTTHKLSSSEWFFGLLFQDSMDSIPVFLLENPDTRDALSLSGKERDRYSTAQLAPIAPRLDSLARFAELLDPQVRTPLQKDLLRTADSWHRVVAIRGALAINHPHPAIASIPDSAKQLLHGLAPQSFFEFAQHSALIRPLIDSLLSQSPDSLSAPGKQFLFWVNGVLASADSWAELEFNVFPQTTLKGISWESPGPALLKNGPGNDTLTWHLALWNRMEFAWIRSDTSAVRSLADSLALYTQNIAAQNGFRVQALRIEHIYNVVNPFYRALLLFFFALVPALIGLKRKSQRWIQFSVLLNLGALALLATGIALRMFITLRPPVTNLYETFVFAGAASVLILLVWGHFKRFDPASLLAAVMGSSLMMLARRYGMDGDTMPKLAAVLDSNFWLTIHVLTITLGYAAVLASGALGHWHLILLRSAKGSPKEMDAFSLQRGVLGLGLLLTFVGTLLGGVWADQSWGRFWGWDPKENGALIIILWVAFLFHAMPAGFFSKRGFSLGSIFAIQTVLFAWFGVNLMGVGLHSYGFTEGTVRGLVLFALMELAFTLWVVWPARKPTST